MAENLNSRVDRLEEAMQSAFRSIDALAEKQAKLDDLATLLIEAQIRTQERLVETDARTKERIDSVVTEMKEHEERVAYEWRARSAELDARVDRLVSAIGEFIRASGKG